MSGFRIIALLLICCTSGFAHSASGPVVQTEYGKVEIVSYMRSEWCNLAANRLFYFIFFFSLMYARTGLFTRPCLVARHGTQVQGFYNGAGVNVSFMMMQLVRE